ncbi:MAG TPA: cobyrinate a,c-diamide synthase [Xanthobacteraceae bacterium]|jgi:cobyrinic acid a,c-diamide synthase
MIARGLIIAAPHSGAGKTIVTLALLAALARRGVAVRAAKAGPDYIDPAFHLAVTGAASVNLDCWAMPPPLLDALAAQATAAAEILVIEGVMGLFDGAGAAADRRGATAHLAAHLALPVILVIDVARQAQSAAALLRGFATHDPAVTIAGVILNRIGSERHRALVTDAIAAVGIPVLGAIPRQTALALPERHLGLVQAGEHADLASLIDRLAVTAERHLALVAIMASAAPLKIDAKATAATHTAAMPPPGQRIALAHDQAFSFIYPHIIDAWRKAGAEILPFSPLADEPPQEWADSCWLPGGYPELHADTLAGARHFSSGLERFAETRPVHGECGGYMVLGESLEDASGQHYAMTGLLGHTTSFAKRKLHLGYRTAQLLADGVLGPKGTIVRGHEFHYASLVTAGVDEPFVALADSEGRALGAAGGRRGRVSGAFFHAIARANVA